MDSCHPQHCKSSIPYCEVLRLWRICSEDQHFQKWTCELKKHLLKLGYREQQLNKEIHWALTISSENCLQIHPNQDKSAPIQLVVTYHPIFPPFQAITMCHLPTLHTSERLQMAGSSTPSVNSFRPAEKFKGFLRASISDCYKSRATWQPSLSRSMVVLLK